MTLHRGPSTALMPFVSALWSAERAALPHARERLLPTGSFDLIVPLHAEALLRFDDAGNEQRLSGGLLQGASDRWFMRDTAHASCVVGVHFRPGGAAALLGIDASDFTSRVISLDELWGAALWQLRERLLHAPTAVERLARLERYLLALLDARRRMPDPVVMFACAQFGRQPALAAVEHVRRATGWSRQRFIARFNGEVGLTPKRYCRVLRFGAALDALARCSGAALAQVALDGGYFDQSHLGNEFRRIAGITPRAYRPVAGDTPHHVAVEKSPRPARQACDSLG